MQPDFRFSLSPNNHSPSGFSFGISPTGLGGMSSPGAMSASPGPGGRFFFPESPSGVVRQDQQQVSPVQVQAPKKVTPVQAAASASKVMEVLQTVYVHRFIRDCCRRFSPNLVEHGVSKGQAGVLGHGSGQMMKMRR